MKETERFLCVDCERTLAESGLIYKRIHGTEGGAPQCEWCRKRRCCTKYRIRYGR